MVLSVSVKSNSGVTERQDNLAEASYKSDYVRPREERDPIPPSVNRTKVEL